MIRSRPLLLPLALAALGWAAAAQAEPNITGMYAVSQPEGKTRQAPPPLTPAAAADQKMRNDLTAKNNRLIGEAHTKCWPAGMPGLMQPPFGIEFLQTPGRITILSEVSNLPRTIYLDEKTHPDDVIPGWNGHSIGHWDGDVLIVDTIGFNDRQPRVSPQMHITERIYQKDGYLFDDLVLNDPANYTQPYEVHYRYKKAQDGESSELMEYVCEVDPANLVAFEAEQKAAGRPSSYDPEWAASNFANPAAVASNAPSKP